MSMLQADIPTLIEFYAKLGWMRILSLPKDLESAKQIERNYHRYLSGAR